MNVPGSSAPDRRRPPEIPTPAAALWPLIRGLRAHRLLVVAIVLLTVLSSFLWLTKRSPQYSASADVLVTPLSATDRSFAGLPLIRAVGPDASSGVGSAVALLESTEAAALTAKRVGQGLTETSVEENIEVERAEDGGLVTVTARAAEADVAAAMANEYVRAALDTRADELGAIAEQQIERSQDLLGDDSTSGFLADENLRARIADLEQLRASGDPTLSVAQDAVIPSSPEGAPSPVILIVSLIGGIGIACMTVVLLDVLGPVRIFDETVLLETRELPVLARLSGGSSDDASGRGRAMMRDMQQNLRSQLELQVKGQARSSNGSGPRTTRAVAITSPSRNDGTSAVAAGLAHAILRAGGTCSVLDLDVISTGVTKRLETAEVFREPGDSNAGETGFSRSSVDVPGLELLTLAGSEVEVEASLAQADGLVELGRVASDWIVVDTPPLPAAVEVLPALKAVDAVVIVVRLRSTSRSEVVRLHEILDLVGIEALGYVVLGAGGPRRRRSAPRPRPRSRAPQSVG